MMIMRFHKLIQSKVVWIFFISIIVISFVALQIASDATPDPAAAQLERTVAKIDGRNVSFLELDITEKLLSLQTRNRMDPDMLRDLALNHLAMVAYADSLGITVDEEFAARQFAMNFANEDGSIDEAALNRFRQNIRGSQISEPDYIEFIRQQIIVDQLRRVMAGAVLVPEFDVERWASLQTDEFTVAYAPVGPDILSDDIEASDEEIAEFFAENSEQFTLPEERVVRYITVSADTMSTTIETPTLEDARSRYISQPEAYTREIESDGEEGEAATPSTEPIPFEDVQDDILNELTAERTLEAARAKAMNLAIRMTPRRGRSAEPFEDVAGDAGLEILESDPFSLRTPLQGPMSSPSFRQEAFDLDFSEFGTRAGPIQVGDSFIIMELVDVRAPRIPELEEVEERVARAATAQKQRQALTTQVEIIAAAIREDVQSGSTFAESAKKQDLNVLTSDPTSLMNVDPRSSMIPNELLRELPSHQAGEVIGPLQTRFGGFFIASIQERIPQPLAKEEALPQIRSMLANQVQFQGMFSRFQEKIIEPMIEIL